MKNKRITYGVSGMMEYQSLIRFGKNTLKVTFTGGSMNAIGVTPATFTTTNFLIQQAIENSNEFKRGRIRIVSTIELDEELRIERAAPSPVVSEQERLPEHSAVAKNTVEPVPVNPDSFAAVDQRPKNDYYKTDFSEEENRPTEGKNANEVESAKEEQSKVDKQAMAQVEFTCSDDAKDYLEQTFGYVRSKLRNRDDIVTAGKVHGVEITFI